MFAPRVCFVDVETTGSNPRRDRVTEVGIVTLDTDLASDARGAGSLRVQEWSSLVNPGVPIPPEIEWLTGITNEMARAAPSFAELAPELFDRLQESIVIAHNARFDYGFLKSEFARAGVAWSARTLCTVRLSRLLYPDRGSHSLDAICARFGLGDEQRHRALGDARILWRWLQVLYERHSRVELDASIARLLSRPATPPHLPPEALDEIPHVPGVYLFYGLNEHPIYIGKSIDLRDRIAGHFGADSTSGTDARLSQEVRRIEWEECAGEIGALLREAELIKTRYPAHNAALRRKLNEVVLRLDDDGRPRFAPAAELPLDRLSDCYGPFGSRAGVRRRLIEAASAEALCLKMMRLEGRGRAADKAAKAAQAYPAAPADQAGAYAPCFNYQLRRCRGACVGVETAAEHGARVRALLAERRIAAWPSAGAAAFVECNAARLREEFHVFDRWCWLGTARTLDAARQLALHAPRRFEADGYRIARTAFERVARGALKIVAVDRP